MRSDYIENGFTYTHKCPHCEKEFEVTEIPQVAGFRDTEFEICPYCGSVNRKSMEVEFFTRKIDEKNTK